MVLSFTFMVLEVARTPLWWNGVFITTDPDWMTVTGRGGPSVGAITIFLTRIFAIFLTFRNASFSLPESTVLLIIKPPP